MKNKDLQEDELRLLLGVNIDDKNQEASELVEIPSREALESSILELTQGLADSAGTDDALDRRNEIVNILGNTFKVQDIAFVSTHLKVYAVLFPDAFYRETLRLLGKPAAEGPIRYKPSILAKVTKEIIYGRFALEVLPTLEHLNPYVTRSGLRRHKHHQWLTDEGRRKVTDFINDAIAIMKTCSTYYEFRVKLSSVHGVPYQGSLFPAG